MDLLGLKIEFRSHPELDADFVPLLAFNRAYLAGAKKRVGLALERAGGARACVETRIYGTPERKAADRYYIDRLVKTLLWMKGGFRITVSGDEDTYEYLKEAYAPGGARDFDRGFMARVFEHPFQVDWAQTLPPPRDEPKSVGGHLDGCRIGFDAGGSDRKVSAVCDGETLWSEEVVWFPKLNADPDYHYQGIVSALRAAAERLPRVDAVGVSTAGVIIDDRVMSASLFLQVPEELYDAKVKDIYLRAVRDVFGPETPCRVVNDGDVSALAGAMSLGENNILGIAMGTSEAAGFVDGQGRVTGWLNELAFAPVDANPGAMRDEWSGDVGCGVKYFSQDGVIKLCPAAGIALEESLSPAEKLKAVQALMEAGDDRAAAVYRSIGVYLAHTLALYHELYGFSQVLLLGRVMSGRGGDLLLDTCRAALALDYPEKAAAFRLALPDEKFRRVGQSAAAASLPERSRE